MCVCEREREKFGKLATKKHEKVNLLLKNNPVATSCVF